MRINSSGNLLVGTTSAQLDSASKLVVLNASGTVAEFTNSSGTATQAVLRSWNSATTGDNLFQTFHIDAGATQKGSIDYNRAGGLVRYNTSSDATLKNIIGDSDGVRSLEILKSTKIREYAWKDDPTQKPQIGPIAQELYETFKGAVSVGGEKTEIDDEGNEVTKYVPWSVDKTAFSFHLVAGWQAHEKIIQEQQVLITQLQADVAALKGA